MDDDRSKQETIVYTVIQCENIYSQPILEPEYGNVLAAYISPLNINIQSKIFIMH